MQFQKILRFTGGCGGDVLIKSILISYPELLCNYKYRNLNEETGAQDLQPLQDFNNLFPNLKNLHDFREIKKNSNDVIIEFNNLLNLKKNFILRSHQNEILNNYTIDLLPTNKTKMFIMKALSKKRGYKFSLIINKNNFILLKKLGREKYIENLENNILINLDDIISNFSHDKNITTEDLLTLQFENIQEKINLKLNQDSKNYLKNWSDMQFKLYGDFINL